eukprot:CAMPEP_0204272868 /NCGR_PEP_ID=MMETSP0468-20130131/22330_1 /ASSEMBLY_ACC=CAM_ASM_000383 /TAXON_ID=2969 /ORGANISM="Oxyrrhis marina" /LENGTH=104 /DNA_ID=CAMNT_0051248767 /DNA_START=31 /DNA_END=345 /DNA_ORIENTATION=+
MFLIRAAVVVAAEATPDQLLQHFEVNRFTVCRAHEVLEDTTYRSYPAWEQTAVPEQVVKQGTQVKICRQRMLDGVSWGVTDQGGFLPLNRFNGMEYTATWVRQV